MPLRWVSSPKLTPPRRPFSRRPIRCGYSIIRRAIPRWTDNSASARIPITAIALTWRKRSAPEFEILARDGEWIEAPTLDGHFLVNIADMCRRWTNDRWRSAPHRVINKTGEVRYSIPYFFGTRPDVRLECLPSCQSADNPPKYKPMSFGEYLAELEPKNYILTKAGT